MQQPNPNTLPSTPQSPPPIAGASGMQINVIANPNAEGVQLPLQLPIGGMYGSGPHRYILHHPGGPPSAPPPQGTLSSPVFVVPASNGASGCIVRQGYMYSQQQQPQQPQNTTTSTTSSMTTSNLPLMSIKVKGGVGPGGGNGSGNGEQKVWQHQVSGAKGPATSAAITACTLSPSRGGGGGGGGRRPTLQVSGKGDGGKGAPSPPPSFGSFGGSSGNGLRTPLLMDDPPRITKTPLPVIGGKLTKFGFFSSHLIM